MALHLRVIRYFVLLLSTFLSATSHAQTIPAPSGQDSACAPEGCLTSFDLPDNAGRFHYYASSKPEADFQPTSALVILHGHPRDAHQSFEAAADAVRSTGKSGKILIIAPLFQVPTDQAQHCHSKKEPDAQPGDALWTCQGWLNGALSVSSHPIGSFAALDALLADLLQSWPSLHTVTVAGFSAGGQLLQRYIGFAAAPPPHVHVRYVVADPGSWLYFDPVRPALRSADGPVTTAESCGKADFPAHCNLEFTPPTSESCPEYNQWKYGLGSLPEHLREKGKQARQRYAAADIHYLEAARDSSSQRGAYYKILDKSCSAGLQGPFRLQRGVAYAAYDQKYLATDGSHTMTIVPDCGHRVACVFSRPQAQQVLIEDSRPR